MLTNHVCSENELKAGAINQVIMNVISKVQTGPTFDISPVLPPGPFLPPLSAPATQAFWFPEEYLCNAGDTGDAGLIPGFGRFPRERHGNPLQYCCLENPMDRGAWQATVQRFAESQTRLSNQEYTHTLCDTPNKMPLDKPFYVLKFRPPDAPTHLKQEAGNIPSSLNHLFLGLLALWGGLGSSGRKYCLWVKAFIFYGG